MNEDLELITKTFLTILLLGLVAGVEWGWGGGVKRTKGEGF